MGRLGAPARLTPWIAAGLAAILVPVLSMHAWARPMHVTDSAPSAEAVMRGRNMQFVVHFDGPVDHQQSRLEILRDGQLFATLRPLLDSAPNTLFASAPAPSPGHYVLHWSVRSMADQEASEGTIPFSVAP